MNVSATWSTKSNSLSGAIGNLAAKAAARVAANIYNEAVKISPVLTGSYRASWRMAAGSMDMSISKGGAVGSPMAAPAEASPLKIVVGQSIFVSNATPYAYRLEYGWSKQAPSGILRISVAAALRRSGYV